MAHYLGELTESNMKNLQALIDSNSVIGREIVTPDGTVILPVSKVSFGFGSGGADYGKTQPKDFGGAAGAGVKIDPVAFLVIKEGTTRVLPVAVPAFTTLDRVVEMVPDVIDKVTGFLEKQQDKGDKESF